MRIQHNIMAMNAYRNLSKNNGALNKNLEKLSSGYRINRAGDDAAGLAISEKMRAQIAGLDQAQKNAQSGINLVQTAEGALTEVHDMLNRMVTLATQAANGTYSATDSEKIQSEINALTEEIDRIAENSNFNGTKLLNGNLQGTNHVGTDAVQPQAFADIDAANKVDGKRPTEASQAELKFTTATGTGTLAAANTGLSGAIISGTTTIDDLGKMTFGGTAKLSDLFNISVGGVAKDWTTDAATALAADTEVVLTAKTAGKLAAGVETNFSGKTAVSFTNGTAEGAGTAATKAEYQLQFDFTKLADGQTFKIGDKTFEISTDGTAETGNTLIDLSNIDLTDGTTDTGNAGRGQAANKIIDAITGALALSADTKKVADTATLNAAINGDVFTLDLTATTAGDAGNLGAVRVSEAAANTAAITGTYEAGKETGPAQAGTFAEITIDGFDLSELAVGDKLTIGGKTVEVVEDDQADANNGKLKLDDAKDGGKLAAAFERLGFNKGKMTFNGTTLKVTDAQDVGRTAQDLYNDLGISFAAKDPATTTSSGGLTLQIGASSDETISVRVDSMKAAALGIDKDNMNVGTPADANAAINTINAAIEKVSVQRSNLGAVQNRLEHTINNLGVMEENIQDAEANIRDTDIADEMMAYTKNNILIQSAQAMLAQANQVPQGVLQLMQ